MTATLADTPGVFPESHLAAPLVIWAVDCDQRVILSEGAGLALLGRLPGDSVGHRVEDLYPGMPELVEQVRQVLSGRRYFETFRLKDVELETRCAPLRNEQGEIVGAMGVSAQISPAPLQTGTRGHFADLYRELARPLPISTSISECRAPFARLYISSQIKNIVGVSAREWLDRGDAWIESVHPDDRGDVLRHLQRAVDNVEIVEHGFRLIGPQGNIIFVEERVVCVRSPEGMPLCLQSVLLDVTARKLAEDQFARSDEYLRLIFQSAGDGIFTVDREGRFNFVNPRLAEMFEICEAGLLGRHFSEFLLEEDRARIVERFERRMAGNSEPREYELQLQTFTGRRFWVEVTLTPLKMADQYTGNLAFLRDITRRKQIESNFADLRERLEQRVTERTREMRLANQVLEEQIELSRRVTHRLETSEARWRSLVEHAPQYVMLLDREGRIAFMNRTAAGFNMQDVLGANLLDMIPEHNRAFTRKILQRVFVDRERETYEIDGYGPNGTMAWYSISIGPIIGDPDGPPSAAVLIAADITERKATEEALQKRQQELAHVSRLNTMGALTAELAHELNQPLEAISAYATACLRALNHEVPELDRLKTALNSIGLQSARASQIIRKIMNFLRKTDVPRQMTDLNKLILEVVEFAELDSKQHQITIECELEKELPQVPVNRTQLEQVLINLLLNAIDAIRAGNSSGRLIKVASRLRGCDELEITVTDDGCGFDTIRLDELFQPFFTTKSHGMGMGLSISRTIVDEHGGRIQAESAPGEGATFTVILPTATAPEIMGTLPRI